MLIPEIFEKYLIIIGNVLMFPLFDASVEIENGLLSAKSVSKDFVQYFAKTLVAILDDFVLPQEKSIAISESGNINLNNFAPQSAEL